MNVFTMLFFIFYIFAVIGVELFNPASNSNNPFAKKNCSREEMKDFGLGDWGCKKKKKKKKKNFIKIKKLIFKIELFNIVKNIKNNHKLLLI
jgi:hypothetical protein